MLETGRDQEVYSSVVFVCRQRTGAFDYRYMPVQEFLKANFTKPSMWNNSLKVLTHEYCKKDGVLLELKKGFYCDFLGYTNAGRFSSVRMSPLTVNFFRWQGLRCSEMFLQTVGPNIHPVPLLVQKDLRALSCQCMPGLCFSSAAAPEAGHKEQPLRCVGSRKHKVLLVVKEDSTSQMISLRINSQN